MEVDVALALVGGSLLLLGLLSTIMRRLLLSGVLVALDALFGGMAGAGTDKVLARCRAERRPGWG